MASVPDLDRAVGGAAALRSRTETVVVQALWRHGHSYARRFRDDRVPGMSRAVLAEAAGVSRPSVHAVEKMFAGSLLERLPLERQALRIKANAGYALGIEYGRQHARVAIADLNGRLFARREGFETRFPVGSPPEPYLNWTADAIGRLLKAADVKPHEVIGVGISRASPISSATAIAHVSGLGNPEWRDVNVADQLEQRLDWFGNRPAITDHDANLSALAEHTFGAARDLSDFIYVKWSDSISAGLVLAGEPYRGSDGYAGQIGHLRIDSAEGARCEVCEKSGCLETKVGAVAIADELGISESAEEPRLANALLAAVSTRPDARERLTLAASLLGEAAASLVDALNPSALIVGGWLGSSIHDYSFLVSAFRDALEQRTMGFGAGIEIRRPRLHRSAVHGATLRVLSEELLQWAREAQAAA